MADVGSHMILSRKILRQWLMLLWNMENMMPVLILSSR